MLWFLIPALGFLTNHSNSGEEISHEENEEADTAHQDLVSHGTEMTKHE